MNNVFGAIRETGIVSLLRSIVYNFRYLPRSQAVCLPIIVGSRTKIIGRGEFKIDSEKIAFGMIKIGVNCGTAIDDRSKTAISIMGELIFGGKADIWKDTKIMVLPKGSFKIGDGFLITGRSSFKIYRSMTIGKDCLFSSDIMVMDYDGHRIFDQKEERINDHKPIIIGNHVWLGARSSIWSGAIIPDNNVIGSGAFIRKELPYEKTIYVGNGRAVRQNIRWEY